MEYTYFVQAYLGGPIKIGYTTKDPSLRLANMMTGSPAPLRIVGLIPRNIEKELHKKFGAEREHGEWFTPTKAILEYIKEHASEHMGEYTATKENLKLEGDRVRIKSHSVKILDKVKKPELGPEYFDKYFAKGNLDEMVDVVDWNDGCGFSTEEEYANMTEEEQEEEREYMDDESPEAEVAWMVQIAEEESFIKGVGINESSGKVGFVCGPCNSQSRLDVLRELGRYAYNVDMSTGAWFFYAIFWDAGKLVGVNLLILHAYGMEDNRHLFDPKILMERPVIQG